MSGQTVEPAAQVRRRGSTHRPGPRSRSFIYAAEAARRAQVSSSTVIEWCLTGALPARKVVGSWRIDPAVLERLLAGEAAAQ